MKLSHVIRARAALSCDLALSAYIYSQRPSASLPSLDLDISIINDLLLDPHSALTSRSYEPGLRLNALDHLLAECTDRSISQTSLNYLLLSAVQRTAQ